VISYYINCNRHHHFFFAFSPTTEFESSVPFARLLVQRYRYGTIARQERQENQLETRSGFGQKRTFRQAFQFATAQRHDSRAQQRLRRIPIQSRQPR